jgi:ABC-2 type transport system ATP-binding protein
MDDIEQICDRIIMIDQGKLLYDGFLQNFKEKYGGEYTITVDFAYAEEGREVDPRLQLVSIEGQRKVYVAHRSVIETTEALRYFIDNFDVSHLNIREADIEDVVRNAYVKG